MGNLKKTNININELTEKEEEKIKKLEKIFNRNIECNIDINFYLEPTTTFEKKCTSTFADISEYLKICDKNEITHVSLFLIMRNMKISWDLAYTLLKLLVKKGFSPNYFTIMHFKETLQTLSTNFYITILKTIEDLNNISLQEEQDEANERNNKDKNNVVFELKSMQHLDLDLEQLHNLIIYYSQIHFDINAMPQICHNFVAEASDFGVSRRQGEINEIFENSFVRSKNLVIPTKETMYLACLHNFSMILQKILDLGMQPDQTCMYFACMHSFNLDIINILYNNKIFIDKQCFMMLMHSALKNNSMVLKFCNFNSFIELLTNYGLYLDSDCVTVIRHRGYMTDEIEKWI